MDYEKFKEYVIKKRWIGPKSGDEYRSLRIQLDHFVEHIEKEDSPLKWLPLDYMSEDELAAIANRFLDRCAQNRLLFQGLSHRGIKYNYNELIIENPNREKELEMILETIPKLKNYQKLKIIELIGDIDIILVGASYEGYQKTANIFLHCIDTIMREIVEEKELFKCIGLGFTNTDYIEQFISVCDRICFGTLYFFIIANKNIEDKLQALRKIEDKLDSAYNTLLECEAEAKSQYKKHRDFHYEYYGVPQNQSEDIALYYVQFLNRKAYYEELEKIEETLRTEPFIPKPDDCFKLLDGEDNLKDYLSEGRKIPSFDVKLEECKKIIDFSREKGNLWCSSSDAISLKVCLLEGYVSKVKYQRRTATAIIRNILSGQSPSMQELMFLDMKMLHGAFRENGMIDESGLFLKICKRVRKMYLLAYSAINDIEAYKFVYRTCFEFLYLFGDSTYTGIKFE